MATTVLIGRAVRKGRDPVRRLMPILPAIALAVPDSLRLEGPSRVAVLDQTIISAEIELSISRASQITLQVHDPDLRLYRDKLLTSQVDIDLGEDASSKHIRRWRLDPSRAVGGIAVSGTTTTLRFWAVADAALKAETSPLRKSAARMSLLGWVRLLAREVHGQVPLTAIVPAATEPVAADDSSRETSLGFPPSSTAKLTVKGAPITREQLRVADEALQEAATQSAPLRPTLALLCAGIVESALKNLDHGDRDSEGFLQARVGIHGRPVARSVPASSRKFLGEGFWKYGGALKIAKENPNMAIGTIAQRVQGSAYPDRYAKHEKEARAILTAYAGGNIRRWPPKRGGGERESKKRTEWRRGTAKKRESSRAVLLRLAEELGRRHFTSAGRLVLASDQSLIVAAPHLSLALDDELLVTRPQIDREGQHALTTLDLQIRARDWPIPPGGVLDLTDAGPATGAWLVETVRARAGDPIIDVTLTQPTTQLPSTQSGRPGAAAQRSNGPAAAIAWAEQRLAVREHGTNTGDAVNNIIRAGGGSPGQPWCGFFCGAALAVAGVKTDSRIGSVNWIYNAAAAKQAPFRGRVSAAHGKPGDLVVLFGSSTHVGLVVRVDRAANVVHTIEGNTGTPGGGQGVARKARPFSSVVAIAQVRYPS